MEITLSIKLIWWFCWRVLFNGVDDCLGYLQLWATGKRSVYQLPTNEGPVSKFVFLSGNYRMRCNYHRPEFKIKELKPQNSNCSMFALVTYIFNVNSASARHKFCMFVCLAYKQEIMNLRGPISSLPLGWIEIEFFVFNFLLLFVLRHCGNSILVLFSSNFPINLNYMLA